MTSSEIIIAGDLGGTKTLLSIYENNQGLIEIYKKKYLSREWISFDALFRDFLNEAPIKLSRNNYGCIAVAGLVENGFSHITNLPWELDEKRLCEIAGLKNLELINDFAVLIYGLPYLKGEQKMEIQKGKNGNDLKGNIAIIGAGTGLGIARGISIKNKIIALPSEGSHREFSAKSEKEWQFSSWIKNDLGLERLSLERVVSGTGLGHIANWRLNQSDGNSHDLKEAAQLWRNRKNNDINCPDLPALVSDAAKNKDPLMTEVLQLWLSAYGSAAGDVALHELSVGGLWLGGGTAKKHLSGLRSETFLKSFRNKGRFSTFMDQLPITVLLDSEVGLFSAACRARMLASEMGD